MVAPEDVITAAKVVSAVAKPTTNVRRSVVRLALVDLYHLGAQWTKKEKNEMSYRHRHLISSTIASACRQVFSDVRNVWLRFEGGTVYKLNDSIGM